MKHILNMMLECQIAKQNFQIKLKVYNFLQAQTTR